MKWAKPQGLNSFRSPKRWMPFFKGIGAVFVFVTFLVYGVLQGRETDWSQSVPALALGDNRAESVWGGILRFAPETWQVVLGQGLPVLGAGSQLQAGSSSLPARWTNQLMAAITQVDLNDPRTFLNSQMGILAALAPGFSQEVPVTVEEGDDALLHEVPTVEEPISDLPGEAVVAIYCTHGAETYAATDGVARLDGKRGGIFQAAAALEKALTEKHGIKAVRSDTIHDFPSYDKAYTQSLTTVKEYLKTYPRLGALLDIHRDATPDRKVVKINGKAAARILFIIGTDARAPHPNWKQNHEFAQRIVKKMDEMYPGLSRGVMTKDGRYHQELHPRAILVELGSDKNSTPEAVYAAQLLADVLNEVFQDLIQEGVITQGEAEKEAEALTPEEKTPTQEKTGSGNDQESKPVSPPVKNPRQQALARE